MLFPNVELRLDVAAKSGFVNIHLLVSPEDPDHTVELKRILKRLQFSAHNDRFDCTRDELIKLGKRTDLSLIHIYQFCTVAQGRRQQLQLANAIVRRRCLR